MTKPNLSSRRAFLKGGAIAAAPLAVAAPAAAMDHRAARVAELEDQASIRALHQAWLRSINAGSMEDAAGLFADPRRARLDPGVRSLAADHTAEPDLIELAKDGDSASGRFHCIVEVETELPRQGTFAQMAHLQGGGRVRRTERRVLKAEYVKGAGGWAIARLELAAA